MYNNFSSKKTKKVISALLATALVATSAPISADAATAKVVGVGKTITYNAKAKVKKVTVKNKKIVTAKKSGKKVTIKGKKAGKTTVTIKTTKKTIKLTVKVGATKITKKTVTTSMVAGTTKALKVNAVNGKGDTIKFTSSNKSTVKVNKASAKANSKKVAGTTVTALKAGTAKIKATSKYTGKSKTFTITVVDATPTVTPSTNPAIVATTPAATANTNPGTNPGGSTTTNAPQATSGAATTAPGSTDVANTNAPSSTDVVETPAATTEATAEATIAPSFDPVTAKEGTLTVTTNVSGASIKVISGGATVDSVSMNPLENSVTTATLQPGVYTVEITKKGYDKKTETVTIDGDATLNVSLAEEVVLGASAAVTNALVGYDNTVLVNESAIVTVTVKDKDGNLVPNKTVVLSTSIIDNNGGTADFEVKGQNVQVTDANGRASFVIGTTATDATATKAQYTGSVEFSARVLDVTDGTNSVATGCVGFAALKLGSVGVDKDTAALKNEILRPGEDAANNASYSRGEGVRLTHSLYGTSDVQYVNTQQVSAEGKKDRAITFNVVPKIVLPEMKTKNNTSNEFVQPVNEKSGAYETYASTEYDKVIELKEDASKLQYATLIFNSIQLSPYTQMTITSYTDVDCKNEHMITGSQKTLGGTKNACEQSNFGYQIPLTQTASGTVKAVKVSIQSAGQVETDMNAGYDIKEIKGIYNASSVDGNRDTKDIATATVSWETVTPVMSDIQPLSAADAIAKYGITPNDQIGGVANAATTKSSFDYQVPVYPFTGNAIIREYDGDLKVVSYYLVPTVKSTETGKQNTNVLATIEDGSGNFEVKAYKATKEEAETYLSGGFTTDGNSVTVNSEKVGTTALKGTINLPGIGSDVLDDASRYVYTSVQWNPIPTTEVSTSDSFIALAGQTITVKAKLIDKNGNPVTKSGQTVRYSYTRTSDGQSTTFNSGDSLDNLNKIAIIKNDKTDINGEATLVLSASDADVLDDLTAEYPDGSYNVVLSIGGENTGKADLYWTNADLSFKDSVNGTEVRTKNDQADAKVSDPYVSAPWLYAVRTVGTTFKTSDYAYPGDLKDWNITIDGLKIKMSSDIDNKGKYDISGTEGKVKASSEFVSTDVVTAQLDSSSVSDKVTFKATKTGEEDKVFTCVGEGTPNMNARLDLTVDWQPLGNGLSILTVDGNTIGKDQTTLYVKFTDGTGKNPQKDAIVHFKSGNVGDVFADAYTGVKEDNVTPSTTGDGIVKTNEDGIAMVTLKRGALAKSSVITASVKGVDQVGSTTINWVTAGNAFGVLSAASAVDENTGNVITNQIELLFNNEVNASSVNEELFDVNYKDANGKKQHVNVKTAKVSGKKVILTLDNEITAGEYTIDIASVLKDSVTYALTDTKGVAIPDSNVTMYAGKNAKFDVSYDDTLGSEKIIIDNVKGAVDLQYEVNDNPNVGKDSTVGASGSGTDGAKVREEFDKYFKVLVNGVPTDAAAFTESNVKKVDGDTWEITYENSNLTDENVEVYFLGSRKSTKATVTTANLEARKAAEDFEAVDKYLKSLTDASKIVIPTTVENGSTVTYVASTTPDQQYTALDGAANAYVDVNMADTTNFTDSSVDTFVVSVVNGGTTLKRKYTIKASVVGSDKSYKIYSATEETVLNEIEDVETALLAKTTGDFNVDTDATHTNTTVTTNHVKDIGTIFTSGGTAVAYTLDTLTDHKGQSATFTITYVNTNAEDTSDTAANSISITKTYKLTVKDDGSDYKITVLNN